ncbi:MAG TPA: serine/threonine-protein kinase, partial [Polyangia bacterium]
MTGRFPRQFGKYVLLKPLAKGGMGEIYLAAGGDVGGFEKLCVIKKVITEKSDQTKANRFLDEAKVGLRLSHSALVSTFDVGEVNGEFYIAMELIEGKDLREVWNRCVRMRQRIPLDVALFVAREVARALAYVHSYGDLKLVHRDVAPPTILLAYVGDVKLTDFGLARSVLKQEHTAPGVVFGRAAYLAPEQARGEVADARTDVYTLGIVLWELLTGQQFLQLSGLDPAAALALVRHPRQVPPSARAPWITPVLDQVALKALAPDREKRFQSAEEFRQALSGVIAEIAPTADSSRVSEFLHGIYADTIVEERQERERFLKTEIPTLRSALAHGVRLNDGDRSKTPGETPAVGFEDGGRGEPEVSAGGASTPFLPGMPGSRGRTEAEIPDRSPRSRHPSSPTIETPPALSAQLREQLIADQRNVGNAGSAVSADGEGPTTVSFLNSDRSVQSLHSARKAEGAAAVAVVQKANEERRRARREAALRVVAELGSEETQGPTKLESALVKAAEKGSRRRRPSQPPPLPRESGTFEAISMPSPFVSAGPVSVGATALATPVSSPPAHDVAILTSATQAIPPISSATTAKPPPPMPIGSGLLARHGAPGATPNADSNADGGTKPKPGKTVRVLAALAVATALGFAICRMLSA